MLLLLFLLLSFPLLAQNAYAPHGGVFTPKGDLRVLVVLAKFQDKLPSNPNFNNHTQGLHDWDMDKNQGLPHWLDPKTGQSPTFLYNDTSDFRQYAQTNFYNYSKDFQLMSLGQFRFFGQFFSDSLGQPLVVDIDAEGLGGWTGANKKVYERMKILNPNFDLRPFDLRKNQPNFQFDNSQTAPDGLVDYVIILYRYDRNWAEQPAPNLRNWLGSGGGFAGLGSLILEEPYNGKRFSEGFTMMFNSNVFIHEIAHSLHNIPHLFGANGVAGEYFYVPNTGWGSTVGVAMYRGLNAWERWYLGWIQPQTFSATDTHQEYLLLDHHTTGDALRIEIPFSNGQSLWLEYHDKSHPFDRHPWANSEIEPGLRLGDSPRGVFAYVEDLAPNHQHIIQALSAKANALWPLHAGGHYDYQWLRDQPILSNNWGNRLYTVQAVAENATDGISPWINLREDLDGDGQIRYDKDYNSAKNEHLGCARELLQGDTLSRSLYRHFGLEPQGFELPSGAFQAGQSLSMSSNPMPLNYPKYRFGEQMMQPYYLNGLSIEFFRRKGEQQVMRVRVRRGQTRFEGKRRWAGQIVLPDITGDPAPDLLISRRAELTLAQSQLAKRHRKNENGDFKVPTNLSIASNACLRIEGTLILEANATLILEPGAKLEMGRRGKILLRGGKIERR
jgi:hypothetical protein